MTVLDHPFIIKLEYSFESKNFIVFVLEFCSGGELFVKLRSVKQMTEEQARFYFSEICLAMFYLHSLSVVYRDLKPENIMIDIDGHIRMGDFGLSKPNMTEEDYAYSFCGSPEYMAPEMILKLGHTIQVDHYTLGALLYELVTGLPPFYSRDTDEIYQSILSEELTFPERVHLSAEIKVLRNVDLGSFKWFALQASREPFRIKRRGGGNPLARVVQRNRPGCAAAEENPAASKIEPAQIQLRAQRFDEGRAGDPRKAARTSRAVVGD